MCGIPYEVPEPRLFSFNNPFGACPVCHGFGNTIELDMNLVVPDVAKSINAGAIEPWTKPHYRSCLTQLKRVAKSSDVRLDVPWQDLSDAERRSWSMAAASTRASQDFSIGSSARSTRFTSACS